MRSNSFILTASAALLLTTSCASLQFADLSGQWELNQRLSDVVMNAAEADTAYLDMPVPLVLNIYLIDHRATIAKRDTNDNVVVAHYHYDARTGALVNQGGPGTYVITPYKHRIILTDDAGHRLVFKRYQGNPTKESLPR